MVARLTNGEWGRASGVVSALHFFRTGGGKLNGMPDVTRNLNAIGAGDAHAADQLLPLVYDELRRLAAAQIAKEKPGQTLDATALVHEAYLRLVGDQSFADRRHFFRVAAEAMRRILIDQARRKRRIIHGGHRAVVIRRRRPGGRRRLNRCWRSMRLSIALPNWIRSRPNWSSCGSLPASARTTRRRSWTFPVRQPAATGTMLARG